MKGNVYKVFIFVLIFHKTMFVFVEHFCSCPPFLKYSSRQDGDQLHFTKHNYEEQYAILGKSKELHCCVGPGYQTLEWFKDGAMFPWDTDQGTSRNSILYSNNQSLILMEVKAGDSGKFTCIARTESGQSLQHTTRLTSFPPPVFAHPPIWNQSPVSVWVARGGRGVLECSATVGQQYNTVTRQPAYAAWLRYGREVEDTARIKISQQWTDDDIVLHLRLDISAVTDSDAGGYTCKVKNQYGVLEKEVNLTVEEDIEDRNENLVKREISSIFRKQIKLYSMLARFSHKQHSVVQEVLKQGELEWN